MKLYIKDGGWWSIGRILREMGIYANVDFFNKQKIIYVATESRKKKWNDELISEKNVNPGKNKF